MDGEPACAGVAVGAGQLFEYRVAEPAQELSIPPQITVAQAKAFTLWAPRSILSGRGDDVLEVAKTNLRQLPLA